MDPIETQTGLARVPRPLDVEIARLGPLERLGKRWERAVTVVVAGAGFGKTTVVAQAVRAHLLAPRGIDVWITCEAAHENASVLGQAIGSALDHPVACARDVLSALARFAPVEVCLIFDDVHEIPCGSPGAALLGELVRRLPATAHVVLCGRSIPDLPLARREAAGELSWIAESDLSFTAPEIQALAHRLGGDPSLVGELRGWPALVRLAFAAGASAPWRYAREEILSRLPDVQRRALTALAALGTATADEIAAVTGQLAGLDDLAKQVPLVVVLDDGRYQAHELWTEALPEARDIDRRAAEILAARGDLARAGTLACRTRDWDLLADLAVELVFTTLSALPRVTAQRWLTAIPPRAAAQPQFVLLRAAVLHAEDFADPRIDVLLDNAWQEFPDTAVLAQAVITAHSRADLPRLAELVKRADRFPDAPLTRTLRHSMAATLAEVRGDPEAALAEIAQAPVFEVPPAIALATVRFHYHCLDMCGFGRQAAELGDRTVGCSDDEFVRLSPAIARWFDGDPVDLGRFRATPTTGTARDAFVTKAFLAVIAACHGDRTWPAWPCGDPDDHDNPRDAVLACAAGAAIAVARGDETVARQAYEHHLTRWPVSIPFNERHLRRFLALGYVLNAELRNRWEAADLGPSHRRARAAAKAFVQARNGDLTEALRLPPEHALCFLPLPWSAELAARLAAAGNLDLARWLIDTLGQAAQRFFAKDVRPARRTGIDVIGVMRVTHDGVLVDVPRVRVRQLLGVLVLRQSLTRGEAVDLLWPGMEASRAARNLRVTLTHLRRVLAPDAHLSTGTETIRLVRSRWLAVDLWTFDRLAGEVGEARAGGDIERVQDLLETAIAAWRGDPLPDLRNLTDPGLAAELDRISERHVRNLLHLGELKLMSGAPAEAAELATQALAVEPFEARGHRLALAAALKSRHPRRIAQARTAVLDALRQLGVQPDPATGLLLRQALSS